jgi:hypothetical protein
MRHLTENGQEIYRYQKWKKSKGHSVGHMFKHRYIFPRTKKSISKASYRPSKFIMFKSMLKDFFRIFINTKYLSYASISKNPKDQPFIKKNTWIKEI